VENIKIRAQILSLQYGSR